MKPYKLKFKKEQIVHIIGIHPDTKKHEKITHVKWIITNDEQIKQTSIDDIITIIDKHPGSVFVKDKKDNTDVEVFIIDTDPKHLRTKANGKETDNLINLPPF